MRKAPTPDDSNAHWHDDEIIRRILRGENPGRRVSWRELHSIVDRAARAQIPFDVICRRMGFDAAHIARILARHRGAAA